MTSIALRRVAPSSSTEAQPAPATLASVVPPPADAPAAPDAALLAGLSAQFAATAADHDQSGRFPHDNFATLQRHGLIGLVAPGAYGGGSATLATARRVMAAVARGEPSTALILAMTYLQHHAVALGHWPAALRERVLRDGAERGVLVNALRVEPVLGSPSRGGLPDTIARRDGDDWLLDGHKLYTTGIEGLGWLAVWARTEEAEPRVGTFLVPRSAPGVRVIASWDHLGLRASGSHETIFENVRIPFAHAVDLRAPADWAPDAGSPANVAATADQQAWMVVLLGTIYDAVARAAQDWLLGFLRERAPGSLGAPLASLPRVQEQVGEIAALLRVNALLLDQASTAVDTGHAPAATDSGLLKYTVTTNAIRVVELALQLSGNHGLARQNPLERHHRDVLCSRIHAPQNDAILLAAGKAALER